jgi:hypothetical protein
MKSRWLRVLALLLGLSMIAAACGDDDDQAADDTEDTEGTARVARIPATAQAVASSSTTAPSWAIRPSTSTRR